MWLTDELICVTVNNFILLIISLGNWVWKGAGTEAATRIVIQKCF